MRVFLMEFIILFSGRGYTFLKTLLGFKLFLEEAIGLAGLKAQLRKGGENRLKEGGRSVGWNSHKS